MIDFDDHHPGWAGTSHTTASIYCFEYGAQAIRDNNTFATANYHLVKVTPSQYPDAWFCVLRNLGKESAP